MPATFPGKTPTPEPELHLTHAVVACGDIRVGIDRLGGTTGPWRINAMTAVYDAPSPPPEMCRHERWEDAVTAAARIAAALHEYQSTLRAAQATFAEKVKA